MPSVRSPPPPRSQVLVYCCDQDHGEPSRSPPRADCGPLPTQIGRDAKSRTPSSRMTLAAPLPPGRRSSPPPPSEGTSSSSSTSSQPASGSGDGCSDANCADGSPSAVFACCGLPLSSGCRPISPVTGCEVTDGCLECPDCHRSEEAACELAECEQLGLAVSCTSPECVSAADAPCFDEDCDEECGAVDCVVGDHADCSLDASGKPVASDVLDCCGYEHSWACEDAPPLFGDFDQLLDCCPPHFVDLNGVGLTASLTADQTSSCSLSEDVPSQQQAPLSAFQALIDAAIENQAVSRPLGSGQTFPVANAPSAGGSQGLPAAPFIPSSQPTQSASASALVGEVPCLWTGCDEVFPNVDLLLDHFRTTASHIPFPNALGLDPSFNAGALQAEELFQNAAAQNLAQQQQQQRQASDDAKATQEILDFFSQSSASQAQSVPPMPAQPVSLPMPAPASASLDSYKVQCQWGGQPHSFTLADLLPPAPSSASTSRDVPMTSDAAMLSPTNLFLKHLMEDHLAGIGAGGLASLPPQPLQVNTLPPAVAVSPALLADDAGSVFSSGGGNSLVPDGWSASTPLSSSSTAGTPTSLDSGAFAGMLHAAHTHPHHHAPSSGFHHHHNIHQYSPLHQPQQHQFFFMPQHVHHAHQIAPHVHAHHQHAHSHSHGPGSASFAHQLPGGDVQHHHCSIDPPQSANSTRPSSSSSSSQVGRSAGRHHPYRAPTLTTDVPLPASASSTGVGGHHSHVHRLPHSHHMHMHKHAHSRHLLPSIKHGSVRSSISSMGEVAQSQGSPADGSPAPSVHACGWPGCGLVFDDTAALTDHLDKVHVGSGKNQYSCGWEGCDRALHGPVFKSKQKIMRHLQSHTGHKPFVCPLCSQTFSEAATLQQHVRRHSTDKPHVCDHDGCAKAFPLASSLAIHKRTHDDVKPFQCPHCARCFTEASNLNKHIRTHTGEKPFVCKYPGCSKRFARPDQLSRHQGVHLRREERERAMTGGEGAVVEDRAMSDDEQDEST